MRGEKILNQFDEFFEAQHSVIVDIGDCEKFINSVVV